MFPLGCAIFDKDLLKADVFLKQLIFNELEGDMKIVKSKGAGSCASTAERLMQEVCVVEVGNG